MRVYYRYRDCDSDRILENIEWFDNNHNLIRTYESSLISRDFDIIEGELDDFCHYQTSDDIAADKSLILEQMLTF